MIFTDWYLPGALVVAQQLRRLDPSRSKVCIASKELREETLNLLENNFDRVWYVEELSAGDSPELALLRRPELMCAPTKLHLWTLPYDRVVYLDADTLPLQPLDELFYRVLASEWEVLAAPDCGWPDLFNSGVLALRPSPKVFKALVSTLNEHNSLDGSDQGVLNEALRWQRVPFLYNVTVTKAYEYAPAFQRFKKDIRVLHFIGSIKPWQQNPAAGSEIAMWWDAYGTAPETEDQQSFQTLRSEPEAPELERHLKEIKISESKPAPLNFGPPLFRFPFEEVSKPATRVFKPSVNVTDSPHTAAPVKTDPRRP